MNIGLFEFRSDMKKIASACLLIAVILFGKRITGKFILLLREVTTSSSWGVEAKVDQVLEALAALRPAEWVSVGEAAERLACSTICPRLPAMVRESTMRMSVPGKSSAAVSALRKVPLNSAEGVSYDDRVSVAAKLLVNRMI
jgi:hypothetical protein